MRSQHMSSKRGLIGGTPCALGCLLLLSLPCAMSASAADVESNESEGLDEPLCRRATAPFATDWRLKSAPALGRALANLELPKSPPLDSLERDFARSRSNPESFRLTSDLNDWRRLRIYGSRNSVRLVTLWDSQRLTLALQTNKRGDPMLRWSSKELSRDEASRGLLDGWLDRHPND